MIVKSNHNKVRKEVMKSMEGFQRRFSRGMEELCIEIDDTIKSHTPVWSGRAVRNYLWSTGSPDTRSFEPIDNGPPGPTNSMPLGVEPRRATNEDAARETLMALDFTNPFQTFILTNNADDIEGLEFGLLPTPAKSRSPNGMFALTQNYAAAYLNAKGILR